MQVVYNGYVFSAVWRQDLMIWVGTVTVEGEVPFPNSTRAKIRITDTLSEHLNDHDFTLSVSIGTRLPGDINISSDGVRYTRPSSSVNCKHKEWTANTVIGYLQMMMGM